jgi:hypothetical protein
MVRNDRFGELCREIWIHRLSRKATCLVPVVGASKTHEALVPLFKM